MKSCGIKVLGGLCRRSPRVSVEGSGPGGIRSGNHNRTTRINDRLPYVYLYVQLSYTWYTTAGSTAAARAVQNTGQKMASVHVTYPSLSYLRSADPVTEQALLPRPHQGKRPPGQSPDAS